MQTFQNLPAKRRKSLTLVLLLCVCFVTFALLMRSDFDFEVAEVHHQESDHPDLLIDESEKPQKILVQDATEPKPTQRPIFPFLNKQNRFVVDRQHLEQTKRMRIAKICDDDHGYGIDLLMVVQSSIGNSEARSAIRDTWGLLQVERGGLLFFMVGSNLNNSDNQLQANLEVEDSIHSDILQGYFPDNSTVLKTISTLKFAGDYCNRVRYVFHVSDTSFVNAQKIVDFAETNVRNRKMILGTLIDDWGPNKHPENHYYLPKEVYKYSKFPPFTKGPNFLITIDAVKPLYQAVLRQKTILQLEDVFITGIVAQSAKVNRTLLKPIKNFYLGKIDECNFPAYMTSVGHSPSDIRDIWRRIYENHCTVKKH